MQSPMQLSCVSFPAKPLPLQKHHQHLLRNRLASHARTCAYNSSSSPMVLHKAADNPFRHIEGLKQYYIPKFPTVLPPTVAPSYERNRKESDEWTRKVFHRFQAEEQKRRIVEEKLPLLIHLIYPEGLDSRLLWLSKYMVWFGIFDSDMDNMEQLGSDVGSTINCIEEYLSFIESGKVSNTNNDLLCVFAPLWEEAVKIMPSHHYARFRDDNVTMLKAEIKQNKLRTEGQIPGSVEELLSARRETGNFATLSHMVEFMIGMDVDEEVKKAVDTNIAADHISLCNDVLSLRPEYLMGDYHNIPCTIAILNHVSLDEGIRQTVELIQTVVDRYHQVRNSLLRAHPNSREVKGYIDCLGYIMAGNLEWCWHTGRYHGPNWVAPQEKEGIMYLNTNETAVFVPASSLV